MSRVDDLYRAALEADSRFTRELVRVYGSKRAAEMRYLPTHKHTDLKVLAAIKAKLKADDALLTAMRNPRSNPARRARGGNTRARGRRRAAGAARSKAPGVVEVRESRTVVRRKKNPASRAYLARFGNGNTLRFNSASDARAVRYATGLGAARAGAPCVSCKHTGRAAPAKKKTR